MSIFGGPRGHWRRLVVDHVKHTLGQRIGRPIEDDAALGQADHPVGVLYGEFDLVQTDHGSNPIFAADLFELGKYPARTGGIETRHGLVGQRLADLRQRYRRAEPLRVFYQVWNQPLYTVGGGQIISDALTVCGARNVFDDLKLPAPQVSIESVLQRNPQMILVGDQAQLQAWKAWPSMAARVRLVPDKGLERPSGQMLEAVARLCEVIQPL
mgnify:CR=1 FL=1